MSGRERLRRSASGLGMAGVLALTMAASALGAEEFPAGDERFHTYAEMRAAIVAARDNHPDIVRLFSIGTSYEGRELWAAKVVEGTKMIEAAVMPGHCTARARTVTTGLFNSAGWVPYEATPASCPTRAHGLCSDKKFRRVFSSWRSVCVSSPRLKPSRGRARA